MFCCLAKQALAVQVVTISKPEGSLSSYLIKQMLDQTSRQDTPHIPGGRIGIWVNAGLRRWQQRQMRAALHKLDDGVLSDIGLSRRDIPCLVGGLTSRELRMAPVASSSASSQWVELDASRMEA